LTFIVSEGYGPEGMTDDSIGVNFNVQNEITINKSLITVDNEIDMDISSDEILVSVDTINIEIDVGE